MGLCQAASAEQAARIDGIFEKWNRADSPGCALAVMKGGQIIYKHGYGMADLEHGAPITPMTPFHVASVSKQFTAAAIVLLAQDGKLSIDDDVHKYIPELPDFGTRITIRNLLHHTSGLRDQWELLELAGWRYSLDLITNQDVLDVVARQKELNFRPGDRYLYSNTGYTLLGEIVKRVSGKSLREFTAEKIFEPLGMVRTHFRDDHAELIKGQAYGYVPNKKNGWRLSITNFDTVGATSLFTTVEDLSRWDDNFYDPKVGGTDFVSQMLHRDPLNDGDAQTYAFGLVVTKYRGLPIVEHSGADAGYRSYLMRFPDQHFSVACLCNAGPSAQPGALAHQVADLFLAADYKEPAPNVIDTKFIQLSAEQLRPFAGAYRNSRTDDVTRIVMKDGTLRVVSGRNSTPLRPVSPDAFRMGDLPLEIHFLPAGPGKAAQAQISDDLETRDTFELLPAFNLLGGSVDEYLGDYLSGEIDPVYRITAQEGNLVLKRLKHEPEALDAVAPDVFVSDIGTLRFVRDEKGRVSGMLLSTGRISNMRFRKQVVSVVNANP
jgi:CubicO group peptidase (beta-lactamase class C family)